MRFNGRDLPYRGIHPRKGRDKEGKDREEIVKSFAVPLARLVQKFEASIFIGQSQSGRIKTPSDGLSDTKTKVVKGRGCM